jgi:hypothetical protein
MELKKCFRCELELPRDNFYKHAGMADGLLGKCKECNKKDVRDNYALRRDEKAEYDKFRHRHDFNRLFTNRYAHIVLRCTGNNKLSLRYKGKKYPTKKQFLEWCYKKENLESFTEIWSRWQEKGFERNYTPSIDRIDNNGGYELDNIQWLSNINNTKKYYNKPFVK